MKRDPRVVWRRSASDRVSFDGHSAVVVGGTGGLGRAISRSLASRGARVTVVGRTFRDGDVPGIAFVKADLSLLSEAARVARDLPAETLDFLLFTTGIFSAPQREETSEGIERDLAVSYLNRLVMLREMAPRLGASRASARMKPRVFVMAYPGAGQTGDPDDLNAEKSYRALSQHMNTVAANEALVLDAARRYPNAAFFGLNPGLVATDIRSNFLGEGTLKYRLMEWVIGLTSPSAETYAEQVTPLLLSPDIEAHSGALFDSKGRAILPSKGMTEHQVRRLIDASDALVARSGALQMPTERAA